MSKKPRGKSGSAAGGGGNKWEAGLLAAAVDEVRFSCAFICYPNKRKSICNQSH